MSDRMREQNRQAGEPSDDPTSKIMHTPGKAEGDDAPDNSQRTAAGHTPGAAEGDRETIEQDLHEKQGQS